MWEHLLDAGTLLVVIGVPALYLLLRSRGSKKAAATLQKSIDRGRDQPISLHPVIDPDRCIGSGACVRACPEKNVLGLIDNRGALISPANCIGHGMCAASCPVQAITLVFGTEKRGVDIPHVNGAFETNVLGLYIAGELGGMGLIRNAMVQGREAVEYIAKSLEETKRRDDVYDLIIVGAGPAGISATITAKREGLSALTLDREDLAGTVLTYPRNKVVMTHGLEIPEYGRVKPQRIHKKDLLTLIEEIWTRLALKVHTHEEVTDVRKMNGQFTVTTSRGEYAAYRVLLAIGRRGSPRKLGVPGEQPGRVYYRLLEPEVFSGSRICVVGGGDSAVEAAVTLASDTSNDVTLIHRGASCSRAREANVELLEEAVALGHLKAMFNSSITKIDPTSVTVASAEGEIVLENDHVFVFIGGELPTPFLKRIGVEFTRKHGER